MLDSIPHNAVQSREMNLFIQHSILYGFDLSRSPLPLQSGLADLTGDLNIICLSYVLRVLYMQFTLNCIGYCLQNYVISLPNHLGLLTASIVGAYQVSPGCISDFASFPSIACA